MKRFALAVTVTAGVLFSASTADAQYRARGSYRPSYATPTYTYPTYSYAAPSYFGGVVNSGYAPSIGLGNGIVVTSGYTPAYSPTIYPSGYSYPNAWSGSAYGSSYYDNSSYYGSGYNSSYYGSGYNGVYISPSGFNGRGWRR